MLALQRAQISAQDDGSYNLFVKSQGRPWVAYADGLGGAKGATCGIVVPLPVRMVWGWSLSTPCGIAPE